LDRLCELLSRNETLKTIQYRRSVRSFTDEPVSEEDLSTILHAANTAPSAHNQQSWRFMILRGQKKQELVSLITEKAASFPRPSSALLRMAGRSIASAPIVVAVANTGEMMEKGPGLFDGQTDAIGDFFRVMEIQSSAAAVENMLLAATSIGLSSVWLGVLILIQKDVLEFLGEPRDEFMAIVPIGYPARQNKSGPKKKSLSVSVKYFD
jgi:nitroreductase